MHKNEQSDGKNKILVFKNGMQQMQKQAMACDYALILAKAAKIVHRYIVSHKGFNFDGKFYSGCQQQSILKTLVSMLLNGADLKDQDSMDSQLGKSHNFTRNLHLLLSVGIPSIENNHFHAYWNKKIHTEIRSKKIIT